MATVKGLDRLKRKLAALPDAVKAAAREQLEKNAEEHARDARRLAPDEEGDLRGTIEVVDGRHELEKRVRVGGPATSKPVKDGKSPRYNYAAAIEFGTSHAPARPFFFPPYIVKRKRYGSRVTRAARKAIKEIAGQ